MADDTLTKEELEALNKEIEQTQAALSDQKVSQAREEGRKEATKELELKQQLDASAKKQAELEAQLAQTRKTAEEQLASIAKKVDEMAASKAVIVPTPPASLQNKSDIDSWSKDKLERIEENSARAFFGSDNYDHMLRGK
jgi:Skp family chaperone for outer membrane proteins